MEASGSFGRSCSSTGGFARRGRAPSSVNLRAGFLPKRLTTESPLLLSRAPFLRKPDCDFLHTEPRNMPRIVKVRAESKEKENSLLLLDRISRCVEKVGAVQDQFDEGKIDFESYYRMAFDAISEEFPEVSPLNGRWYDVDGNVIGDISEDRLRTLLQGRNLKQLTSTSKKIDAELCKGIISKVFANSPFQTEYNSEELNGTRNFEGQFVGDLDEAYAILSKRLSQNYPDLFLTMQTGEDESFFGSPVCTVGHKDLFATTPEVDKFSLLVSVALSFIFAASVIKVDLDVITPGAALWNGILLPLGLSLVIFASFAGQAVCSALYGVAPSVHYFPYPAPNFGFNAILWNNSSMLPNRACLIDQALASSVSALIASLFLMAVDTPEVPFYLRLLAYDFGWHETAGALTNVALIDSQLFGYSAVLSEFSVQLSTAILATSNGETVIAIRPLALAGLMGLHMTTFSLIPFGSLTGGRIIRGVGGGVVYIFCSAVMLLIVFCVALFHFDSVWFWAAFLPLVGDNILDEKRRNDLSSPGAVRSLLGLSVIGMGLFVLLPKEWFSFLFQKSPSMFVDQVGGLMALFS